MCTSAVPVRVSPNYPPMSLPLWTCSGAAIEKKLSHITEKATSWLFTDVNLALTGQGISIRCSGSLRSMLGACEEHLVHATQARAVFSLCPRFSYTCHLHPGIPMPCWVGICCELGTSSTRGVCPPVGFLEPDLPRAWRLLITCKERHMRQDNTLMSYRRRRHSIGHLIAGGCTEQHTVPSGESHCGPRPESNCYRRSPERAAHERSATSNDQVVGHAALANGPAGHVWFRMPLGGEAATMFSPAAMFSPKSELVASAACEHSALPVITVRMHR